MYGIVSWYDIFEEVQYRFKVLGDISNAGHTYKLWMAV